MPNFRNPLNRDVVPPRYYKLAKAFVDSVRNNYDQTVTKAEDRLETMLQSAWIAGYDASSAVQEAKKK